jgi:hypothetical protein
VAETFGARPIKVVAHDSRLSECHVGVDIETENAGSPMCWLPRMDVLGPLSSRMGCGYHNQLTRWNAFDRSISGFSSSTREESVLSMVGGFIFFDVAA